MCWGTGWGWLCRWQGIERGRPQGALVAPFWGIWHLGWEGRWGPRRRHNAPNSDPGLPLGPPEPLRTRGNIGETGRPHSGGESGCMCPPFIRPFLEALGAQHPDGQVRRPPGTVGRTLAHGRVTQVAPCTLHTWEAVLWPRSVLARVMAHPDEMALPSAPTHPAQTPRGREERGLLARPLTCKP